MFVMVHIVTDYKIQSGAQQFSLNWEVQERYSNKHILILKKNARKDPPVTVITDADLINEIHDIKINNYTTNL